MSRYIIEYHSKTRASLSSIKEQQIKPLKQWIFSFPNLQDCTLIVAILDSLEKHNNIYLYTGLKIITDITTDSEVKARSITQGWVETILNLVSFSTLSYCNKAALVSITKIQKEAHPYTFYVYQFNEKEIFDALIKINSSMFSNIFKAYEMSDEQPRINRAISWMRKGMGEENHIDQFVSYWTGLEVIKSILRRELKNNTPKVPNWGGVENVFKHYLSFYDFAKIYEARKRIFHGGKKEDIIDKVFLTEISGYLEPMRKALIYCVGNILKIEQSILKNIADKKPDIYDNNIYSIYHGNITNMCTEFSEIVENYPTIDVAVVDKKYAINEKGEIDTEFEIKDCFHSGGGIELENIRIQFLGKNESGMKIISAELISTNQE